MTLKTIILGLLVISIFAFAGLSILNDVETTYNITVSDNSTKHYEEIQNEHETIKDDMEQIHEWLQDLSEGELTGFVFAMPSQIVKILGLFLHIPNLLHNTLSATLSVFGIPTFVMDIFGVMVIVVIIMIIIGLWAKGEL